MAQEAAGKSDQNLEQSPRKELSANAKLVRAMVLDSLAKGGGLLTQMETDVDGGLEAAISRGKIVGKVFPKGVIQFGFEVDVEADNHNNRIAWHVTDQEDNSKIEAILRTMPDLYGSIFGEAEEVLDLGSDRVAAPTVAGQDDHQDRPVVELPQFKEDELLMFRFEIFKRLLQASPSGKVKIVEQVIDTGSGTLETGFELLLELQDEKTIEVTDHDSVMVFPEEKIGKFSAEGETRGITFHYPLTATSVLLDKSEIERTVDTVGGRVVIPHEKTREESIEILTDVISVKWQTALALPKNYMGTDPKIEDLQGNRSLPWMQRILKVENIDVN